MNPHLQRATLLIGQSRYQQAEQELRQSLAEEPDDALAHATLAICLTHLDQRGMAMREAELAIGFNSELPFVFYAKSVVEAARNCFDEAEEAIRTAIGLDPYCTRYFAQLARVQLEQQHWQTALAAAEQGLDLDPEDVDCTNLRAMALARLGRRSEANEAIATALRRNPEDSDSHANMGWSLLENRKPEKALEFFREALRLAPENDSARAGIVEAMKARYFVYRIILGWFVWMLDRSSRVQWGILLGAFVGYHVLRRLATHHQTLLPWLMPLLVAYGTFALMTWIASPLLNLVLRLNRFGRLALTRQEITTSNWVGLCVLGAIAFVVWGFAVHFQTPDATWDYLLCAIACSLVIPPLAYIYFCDEGWPRAIVVLITFALLFFAVTVLVTLPLAWHVAEPLTKTLKIVGRQSFLVLIIGTGVSQVAMNALLRVRPRPGSVTTATVWTVGGLLLAVAVCVFLGYSAFIAVTVFAEMKP